jgi:ribonuclease HI
LRNEISSAKIVNGLLTFTYTSKAAAASNNRGELCGFLMAVLLAKESGAREMVSVMDSTYCINTLKKGGWLEGWRKNKITDKKNMDIIDIIEQYMIGLDITFFHQRAHLPQREIQKLNGLDRVYADLNVEADTQANIGKINASR